jgi:hypothetical protein
MHGLRSPPSAARAGQRQAPRHPLHRAFDGEEGLNRPFPPTRFSKEAFSPSHFPLILRVVRLKSSIRSKVEKRGKCLCRGVSDGRGGRVLHQATAQGRYLRTVDRDNSNRSMRTHLSQVCKPLRLPGHPEQMGVRLSMRRGGRCTWPRDESR